MSQWRDDRVVNSKFIMTLTSDQEIGYPIHDYNASGTLLHYNMTFSKYKEPF